MTIRLLGRTEIRHLAKELDFRPRKAFGQNFVHDANTVRRIVSASGVNRQSHVLEVGPGLGSLTLALLASLQQDALPRIVASRECDRAQLAADLDYLSTIASALFSVWTATRSPGSTPAAMSPLATS